MQWGVYKIIQIIIVDSQEMFRNYLCEYLSSQKDFKVAAAGKDSYEAVKLVDFHKPDIVLMDIDLPQGDSIKTAGLIKYRSPQTSVIVRGDDKEQGVFSFFFNGVSGYITKQASSELLCHAIRAVYYGGSFVSPEIVMKFQTIAASGLEKNASKYTGTFHSDTKLPRTISPSEMQIIAYVGRGLTNREIAEKLRLTEGTVRNYVSSVLHKTGFRDRTQVAIYAIKAGL